MIDRISFLLYNPFLGDWNENASDISCKDSAGRQNSLSNIILACSAPEWSKDTREKFGMRRLGEDRREFFDHLKPGSLVKGAAKVVITQTSTVYSNYLSDQLKEEMKRDDLVNEGKISREEAERQADEWSQKEWPKRWESFPHKLLVAYMKYHAVTIMMRSYEWLAAKKYDAVMVDKLTLDTYASTLRRDRAGEKMNVRAMTSECFYSNLIAYLADYSVHQIILAFGYFVFIREQRRKLKSKQDAEAEEAEKNLHPGSLVISFTKKSVSLAFTRFVGLSFAAVGGAIGGLMMPGWGSVIGLNMGDGLAITITDEIVSV